MKVRRTIALKNVKNISSAHTWSEKSNVTACCLQGSAPSRDRIPLEVRKKCLTITTNEDEKKKRINYFLFLKKSRVFRLLNISFFILPIVVAV